MNEGKFIGEESSYFSSIVKTIIDIDNSAIDEVNEVEKKYEDVTAQVNAILEEYRKKKFAQTDKEIEKFKADLDKSILDSDNDILSKNKLVINTITEKFNKNKEEWKANILKRIFEN